MTTLPSDATVLVTGANGFVGSRVCRHLAGRGVAVRALVRREDADLSEAGSVDVAVAELDDPDGLADAMSGVTHVVHCAAGIGPDLAQAAAVNVDGTRAVLEAAAEAGVGRIVHVSTTSVVHGDAEVVDADSQLVDDDASAYAVTKRDAETVAAEVAAAHDLSVAVLRPPCVLGWGPTSTWGQKIPSRVAAGELPLEVDRRGPMGWVHVDDFAAAVELALVLEAAIGRTFVVANGTTTWGEYLDEVVSWFEGAPDPFTPAEEAPGPRVWSADAIRDELGWAPSRTFDEAMAEAAAHHR